MYYEAIFQDDFTDIDSSFDNEKILNSDSDKENKLLYLTKMGYSEVEASIAMEKYGPDSSIAKLTDFICAAQMAKAADALLPEVPNRQKGFVRLLKLMTMSHLRVSRSFPKNHTRGGSARDMFPGGINVMSILSGISDTEVAFYCLGIPLKTNVQELNGDQLEQLMRCVDSTLLLVAFSVTTLPEEINIIGMN
ncbi:hypothetical protein F3Y22_tig00111358pilonHSYRG00125 [Hibiscus syriacus]|uniref:DNA (Cytosine-5)-methyltransferase DRM1/2 n=1 Tax=Hibiscus syriacus TaxID=106335 RepID=A0A6A2YNQ5_HIBSY|nr:hypothetical protein F3Y22_tig00111358pilonHSYRG00125 [Hibiscus syriacus]